MYRDVCVTEGAGAYKFYDTNDNSLNGDLLNVKGATISGKVDRDGAKTNKEMMVSAYSTQGRLVGRSASPAAAARSRSVVCQSGNYP